MSNWLHHTTLLHLSSVLLVVIPTFQVLSCLTTKIYCRYTNLLYYSLKSRHKSSHSVILDSIWRSNISYDFMLATLLKKRKKFNCLSISAAEIKWSCKGDLRIMTLQKQAKQWALQLDYIMRAHLPWPHAKSCSQNVGGRATVMVHWLSIAIASFCISDLCLV